jgi:hypothetical protein
MDPDALFSGWGLRTMSKGDGGYNPIEYHNGTAWSHYNSPMARGPYRYGIETDRIASALLEAASYLDYRGSSPATTEQTQTYPWKTPRPPACKPGRHTAADTRHDRPQAGPDQKGANDRPWYHASFPMCA